jgi:UDP-N-acetylglucosamine 4-epimerase
MSNTYDIVRQEMAANPRVWLVTGVAGFIGSNLLDELLSLRQTVVGLDNFSTGHQANLDEVLAAHPDSRARFRMISGDIRDPEACRDACESVDFVLHQAALGSVPRSVDDPITSTQVNVDGFLQILVAARDAGAKRVVYASSSSVYGDSSGLPQREDRIGRPLSPYAATKSTNELFAGVFQRTYGMQIIGLRYFNVFGRRQDPEGPYAAVIPRWVASLLHDEPCRIHGDGETSRDFCHVSNAVAANLLAAVAPADATGEAYNIACNESTTLNALFALLREQLARYRAEVAKAKPIHDAFRPGDVRHSMADIEKARQRLGYEPITRVRAGLAEALEWYAATAMRPS